MARKKKQSKVNTENNSAKEFISENEQKINKDKKENEQEPEKKLSGEIFVYTETVESEDKKEFHPVVFELLAAARKLSEELSSNLDVSAVVCSEYTDEELNKKLYIEGADKIYFIKCEKNDSYIKKARAITELCKAKNPEIFLIGATIEGRSLAPLVSSALDTGLTADCTKLEITDFKNEKKLAATRPTFGGQLMATILCKKLPQMATVRPSVLQKSEEKYKEQGEFEEFTPDMEGFVDPIRFLGCEAVKNKLSSELENAQIIVAGGKGLKTEENFDKLKKFAKLIGATVAGSRGAVDTGLIEKEYQVGQTGKTVSPKVYIAFGISGAIHHMVGIENSKKIIAINTDENAPIFQNADVKIVKDAAEILDELLKEVEGETEEK